MLTPKNKLSVITAFANSKDAYLNMLTRETESLKNLLTKNEDQLEHIHIPKATLNGIIDGFIAGENRIGFFHFGGHAKDHQLQLEDARANAIGLADLMKSQNCVPLVFLNGCSTHKQIQFFKDAGVGAIISTVINVYDNLAVIFAERFYQSFLTQNRSIEESFDDDVNLVKLEGEAGSFKPTFQKKRKIRKAELIEEEIEVETSEIWTLEAFDNAVLNLKLSDLDAYIQRRQLVSPYAQWLKRQHATIKVGGIKGTSEIDLDKVFVSLRGELSKTYEIIQSQRQLREDVQALEQLFSERNLSRQEQQRQKSILLGRSAIMPIIEERDRQKRRFRPWEILNLVEAYKSYDKLVILGDPGTGKTTLARWLVLMLAKELNNPFQDSQIQVSDIKFKHHDQDLFERSSSTLGFHRLPILIRVSEFATKVQENSELSLKDFLGHQSWFGEKIMYDKGEELHAGKPMNPSLLNALMLDYIYKGEALVILDGLDEIIEEKERQIIVRKIESFVEREIDFPDHNKLPHRNKFIVTSRIAGYHSNPLDNEELFHVTIQPMERYAIQHFCHNWMLATQKKLLQGTYKTLEIEHKAYELARQLIGLIFAPERSGILELAGNPLLLSELGKIFLTEDLKLPDTRVDLYEKTARNMLDIWRERSGHNYKGNLDIFEEKIFYVLEDIAAYVHENYPTGLIERTEIASIIEKSLRQFRIENPDLGYPTTVQQEKSKLLKALNQEVGILAARAADLYGFLHLTFEEFFAARKILRHPDTLIDQILPKAYQPRWREPLLLAISYLGKKFPIARDRNQVLDTLLEAEDPMGNIIPRSANLIALAIPEMNFVPDTKLIQEIVMKLLEAYASAGPTEEGKELRENVEGTFKALKRNQAVWQNIINSFCWMLQNEGTSNELRCASAHLHLQIETKDLQLAEAYTTCLACDSVTWNWSIHQLVLQVAKQQANWRGLANLPMRKYLIEYPEMLETINQNADWIKVFILLYGGIREKKEDKKTPFEISHDTIYSDSYLTDDIIDLLEEEESPRELLASCTAHWQDEGRALDERIDSLMYCIALGASFSPALQYLSHDPDSAFAHALKDRISPIISLCHALFPAILRAP